MGRSFRFGRRRNKQHRSRFTDNNNESMISIWDSGIEYGHYKYGTVYGTDFGFNDFETKYKTNFTSLENIKLNLNNQQHRHVPSKMKKHNEHRWNRNQENGSKPGITQESGSKGIAPANWSEFTRSTTFHGVRFVFDERNVPAKALRRAVWIVCVVTAITLFLVQVYGRAQDYFNYRTNTNVEVVYVNEEPFPSVTICNQNSYRLTETVSRGLYPYIDAIYSSAPDEQYLHNMSTAARTTEVNLTNFVLETAHQKTDFFDSCSWKGETCAMEMDFQTIITDFGVCYTFNLDGNRSLSQAGSGFALSLVLNIEQYQYMKGPQDEAGIKVLLHDPSETPLVKELGFAIAPGTHTLVAVRRNVIETLSSPWGVCVQDSLPRSECLSKCKTNYVINRCGCHDPGMTSINNSSVCNMEKSFTCVQKELDKFTRSAQGCECHIPCYRVTYEAELSYAHLSKLNVDRISLNDAGKLQDVQTAYRNAREVSQRVDSVIAERDSELVNAVLTSLVSYDVGLNHSVQILDPSHHSMDDVIDILEDPTPVYLHDLDLFDNIYVAKEIVMTTEYPDLGFFYDIYAKLAGIIEEQQGSSVLRLRVSRCAVEEQSENPTLPDNEYDSCSDSGLQLTTFLSAKRRQIRELSDMVHDSFATLSNFQSGYIELMDYLFGEELEKWDEGMRATDCLSHLQAVEHQWNSILHQMYTTSNNYLNTTKWTDKLQLVDELITLLNYTDENAPHSLLNEDFSTCNWYLRGKYAEEDQSYSQYQVNKVSAINAYYDARSMLVPLIQEGHNNIDLLARENVFMFDPLRAFLAGNETKTALEMHMVSEAFTKENDLLGLWKERYLSEYDAFLSKVTGIENNLRECLRLAFEFDVPVMNRSVVNNLELVEFARLYINYSSDISSSLELLNSSSRTGLDELVTAIYGEYRHSIQEVQTRIIQHFQELQDSITEIQSDLRIFVSGNEIDENFFMENFIKMDIFYKELSHEQIRQQISFHFLSLVSEVGGFLGLLLGASVLTICELVDFLALAGIQRCRSKTFASPLL